MGESFIKKEKLNGLLQLASQKTGIPAKALQEKIEPYLPDTFYTVTIRKDANDTESRIITITKETR